MKNLKLGTLLVFAIAVALLFISCENGIPLQNVEPDIVKVQGASGTVTEDTITFEWQGVDMDGTVAAYEYRKDGGSWHETGHETYIWDNYSTGEHTFSARAIDNDNAVSDPITWHFTYNEDVATKVLIDDTHSNFSDADENNDIKVLMEDFKGIVEALGFEPVYSSSYGFNMEDVCLLVLHAPFEEYSSTEKEKIRDLVEAEKNILFSGEWGYYSNGNTELNDVLDYIGSDMTLQSDCIHDDDNNYGQSNWPIISDFKDHDISQGVSEIVEYAGCSVQISGNAEALSYASNTAYLIQPNRKTQPATTNRQPTEINTSGYEYKGNSRIFVIGDTSLMMNKENSLDLIEATDNRLFTENILRWLLEID